MLTGALSFWQVSCSFDALLKAGDQAVQQQVLFQRLCMRCSLHSLLCNDADTQGSRSTSALGH